MRLRNVVTFDIKALTHFDGGMNFIVKIYEPYKYSVQNRNSPDSRYSAKVWNAKNLFNEYAKFENLTSQEAFKDLPTYIFEQWGYRKGHYITTLNDYPWSYSKHPWQYRKERKNNDS